MSESELSNHAEFLAIKHGLKKRPPSASPSPYTKTHVSTKRKSRPPHPDPLPKGKGVLTVNNHD